jgi:hypothetical protein
VLLAALLRGETIQESIEGGVEDAALESNSPARRVPAEGTRNIRCPFTLQ